MTSKDLETEILVHISAPATTADDVRYKRLARAYMGFTSQNATNILSLADNAQGPGLRNNDRLNSIEEVGCSLDMDVMANQPLIDSQDISFQSVLDNQASPRWPAGRIQKGPKQDERTSGRNQEDLGTPTAASTHTTNQELPSEVDDSYPMPSASLLHVSPTRVLQHYMAQFAPAPTPSLTYRNSSSGRDLFGAEVPSSVPVPSQELASSRHVKEFQVKLNSARPLISLGNLKRRGTIEASEPRKRAAEHTPVDIIVIHPPSPTTMVPSTIPTKAGSEPPQPKRLKTSVSNLTVSNLVRSSSDVGPGAPASSPLSQQSLEALVIRSPSPPPEVEDLQASSLISSQFAKVAQDLSSRYRPQAKRELDEFERGYWLVDCSRWSDETRREAWIFLTKYLKSGLGGWGLWCRRDTLHQSIRLYCWGCVVKHAYLLLYLASGRRIKTTGAKWIDADGVSAIEVAAMEIMRK